MNSELILLVLSLCTLEASGQQLTYAIPLSIIQSRVRELLYCLKEVWTSADYRDCYFRVKFPGDDLHFTHSDQKEFLKLRGMVTLKRLEPLIRSKNVLISSVKLHFTIEGVPIIQEMKASSRLFYKSSSVIKEPFYREKESSRQAIIRDCLRNPKKCVITHIFQRKLSKQPSVRNMFHLGYISTQEMSGLLNKESITDGGTHEKARLPLKEVQINSPEGGEMITGYFQRNPFGYVSVVETPVTFPQTFTVWNHPQDRPDQEGTQLILRDPHIQHGLKFRNIGDGNWIPSNEVTGFIKFPFCSKGEQRSGKYISDMNTIPVTEPELRNILEEVKPSCVANRVGVAIFSEKVQVYLQYEGTSSSRPSYNIKGDLYVEGEQTTGKVFCPGNPLELFYNTPEGVQKKLDSVDGYPITIWLHESPESKVPESAIVEKKVQYVDLIRLKRFLREKYESINRLCDHSTDYVMTHYKHVSVYRECDNPIREMFIGDLEGVRAVNYYGQQTPESLRYKIIYYDFDRDLYMTANDIIVGLYAFVKKIDYFKFDFEDKEVRIHMDQMLSFLRETLFDDLNGHSPNYLAAIRLGDKYVLAVNIIATTNPSGASTSSTLPTFKIRGKFRKIHSSDSTEDRFEANELLISEDTCRDVSHQYIDKEAISIRIPSKLVLTQKEKDRTVSVSYFARMNVVEAIIKNIIGDIHKEYCEDGYDDLLNVDIEMEEHYYIRCNYHCSRKKFSVAIKTWGFSKHFFTKYDIVVVYARGKMYTKYKLNQRPTNIYAFHIEKNEGYVQTGDSNYVRLDNGKRFRYFVSK